ncbi:F0F1 ATP synthase subunit delta [Sulfurimonas aquatica]|uniref:ATP synthase subunit delta n=1 Tax=Sulfurimonas aquatica TaxID=2672570 RepID=A0A975B108_9BACT|nr:F0F1 ATP synthase subunit delta [Sulfurimonas aquatica]QSZ42259.1 F0F1 ATP synthase subunit delta [Sulfurimonas aquatica]
MEELIAKRYIKALKNDSDLASMQNISDIFSCLSDSFSNDKFVSVIVNPHVSRKDKSEILLEAVKSAQSDKVNNFIKLLVENKRINIIPAIAKELQKDIANSTKVYSGIIYSDSDIETKVLDELSSGLSKKFDSTISLAFKKNDFNGIKVEVEGLGIEINFSKDRIDSQIIDHIIKAI